MTISLPMPTELMTAAERAGWRMACEAMRMNGARIERSGTLIGSNDDSPVRRGELLTHCGKMVQVIADLTEIQLETHRVGAPVSIAPPL